MPADLPYEGERRTGADCQPALRHQAEQGLQVLAQFSAHPNSKLKLVDFSSALERKQESM
jgi:hypothetical protein